VTTPKFEAFALDYVKHFGPGTVTSGGFRDYFVDYFRMETAAVRAAITGTCPVLVLPPAPVRLAFAPCVCVEGCSPLAAYLSPSSHPTPDP